MNSAWTRFS